MQVRPNADCKPGLGAKEGVLLQQGGSVSCHELRLRFFDLEACIRSDSATHIDLLSHMYSRFRAGRDLSPAPYRLAVALLTQPENPWRQPVLIVDEDVWLLENPRLLEGWVYDRILSSIVARVRSHFLVHAGVVAREEHGVILSADAGHGKTTLVLELVRRGFRFLSDEMAALGRADRQVYPFPRSLRIRPDTLARVGYGDPASGTLVWMDKLLLDIEEIYPGSMGEAAAISYIVFLQDPAQATEPSSRDVEHELSVLVDRVDHELLIAIRKIDGVEQVSTGQVAGYPLVRVVARRRIAALIEIEKLCRQRRTLILDVIEKPRRQPAFAAPARLELLPKSQAVMELLCRFQGGLGSALLQEEFGRSAARFYWEMTELVTQATCYQLTVGPLEQMASLICSLLPIGN
jgi:hypothetical protein